MTNKKIPTSTIPFFLSAIIAGGTANADIHTMGSICQPSHQPLVAGESVQYGQTGILNSGRDPVSIICAVPRPSIATGTSAIFTVQGRNDGGTSSNCGLEVVDSAGVLKSIESFVLSGTTSAIAVTIPAARITNTDHVFIFCTLAGRSGQLVGFTAVGP